jgi:hypothetical protein
LSRRKWAVEVSFRLAGKQFSVLEKIIEVSTQKTKLFVTTIYNFTIKPNGSHNALATELRIEDPSNMTHHVANCG